tara:strand:+ start:78 stop:653 length:576 start_codon:yes stop_codon:yes gene_type:complete
MTATNAITKIRVLLGVEEEVIAIAMASDKLVDGTEVKVEGELEAGKALVVVTAEGDIPAPAGKHMTESNKLITVDEAGVITQIEEVTEEATEEVEEEVKVEMEEEVTVEVENEEEEKVEVEMEEEMIVKIVEAMKPYFEEIKELKEKVVEMEGNFSKFSKEPATKPIKKAEAFAANKFDAIERIQKIRKSK